MLRRATRLSGRLPNKSFPNIRPGPGFGSWDLVAKPCEMLISFSTKFKHPPKAETGFIERLRRNDKKHTFRGGFRWYAGRLANIYTGARTKQANVATDHKAKVDAITLMMQGLYKTKEGRRHLDSPEYMASVRKMILAIRKEDFKLIS